MSFSRPSRGTRALSIGSAALVLTGLTLSVPAAASAADRYNIVNVASAPDYVITVDCATLGWNEGIDINPVPGGSVTIQTENCTLPSDPSSYSVVMDVSVEDGGYPELGGYTVGGTAYAANQTGVDVPATFTAEPNTRFNFLDSDFNEMTFHVEPTPPSVADPAGSLIDTFELIIPATDPRSVEFPDDLDLSDPEGSCGLDAREHVYQTYEFDVTEAGQYTARFVETSPANKDFFWFGENQLINNAYLAIYSEFDPTDPSTGVVGCNDNRDGEELAVTANGYLVGETYPEITTTLAAGTYTLLLTTYEESLPYDWAVDQGGSVELWSDAESAPGELAATGASENPAALPLGLSLMVLGLGAFVAVAVRRRFAKD
jgi:hypothetical protein